MRLLERKPDGDVVFRESTTQDVPAYAILSHTWLANNNEEVTFQDVEAGIGKSKPGWRKVQFCADKATADGLRYFWIDTCCIDKKNSTELSKAINSMFRWYQKATRCYVYLADVSSTHDGKETPQQCLIPCEATFRKSRWFTRGWTLQELLAPTSVDFFSLEGERLGSKLTLEDIIHNITSIPKAALRGGPLDGFSRDERLSWALHRHTKEEEDHAYSLLGIFDVFMPLIYGEGKEKAYKRLQEEIEKIYSGDSHQFALSFDLSAIPEPVKFVARENELAEMRWVLHGHKSRSAVVLHGLGGIGKTQLALEYTVRYKEKYTAIFWLNANDEDSIKLSFRDIAQRVLEDQMGRPSISMLTSVNLDGNLDQVVTAVKTWLNLQRNTRWLMIYDNYDNPQIAGNLDRSAVDIRRFLPRADHGSTIITTRSAQVSQGHRIHVERLRNIHEGLKILLNTSKRENIEKDCDAIALVKELDGLPLALSAAGAYLEHVATSFSDYLRLYKASWLKLQMTSPQLSSYKDRSLYTTWQITFDRIKQQNPASAKLLKLWAYFDRQDVWFELLRHMESADDEWIQKLTEDELSFNEAVTLLSSFGLVDADRSLQQHSRTGGYSMHSCVHSWTVFVLNKEWDKDLAKLALICVASEIPNANDKDWWLLQRRLLQHATRQNIFIVDGSVDIEGLGFVFHNLGSLYSDQGKLAEAEKMYIRALQSCERELGPDHTSTLETVHHLGLLYNNQGKLAEAEKMYIRALQGFEKVLGPDHTSTLDTVHNLGRLYVNQAKLADAEKMYIRALQGSEKALGPDHTSTLDTVHNLGNLYSSQGKLAEAEKMYIRARQGYEIALGPDHTSTLHTVCGLGDLYRVEGKLAEAEPMCFRALAGYEKALGPGHPSTLLAMVNVGTLLCQQQQLSEAERIYQDAMSGFKKALGPDHFDTLVTASNLANLYCEQGKLFEAKGLYEQALAGMTKTLAQDHWCICGVINNLGLLHAEQGNSDLARQMYQEARDGFQRSLGPEHPLFKMACFNITQLELAETQTGDSALSSAEATNSVDRPGRRWYW